ncbi:MAG: hypothetical protein EXS09_01425 [Gemmataceae bacterium]|nr:hypothetical protein [Gemmataceae bacterium]
MNPLSRWVSVKTHTHRNRRRLRIEMLEQRDVPAVWISSTPDLQVCGPQLWMILRPTGSIFCPQPQDLMANRFVPQLFPPQNT